ncbi:MAG: hypothetical protein ACR2PR_12840 [Pseudohongiellaceae bacterium]
MASSGTVVNNNRRLLSQNGRHYAAALVHGVVLLWLYQLLQNEYWPYGNPIVTYALITVLIAAPIIGQLVLPSRKASDRVLLGLGIIAVVLALMGAWLGNQLRPYELFDGVEFLLLVLSVLSLTTLIFCLMATLCLQVVGGEVRAVYAELTRQLLHNTLALVLALLFAVILFFILQLWGALFARIGVEFFRDIFTSSWFNVPMLVAAFGSALSLTKHHELIDRFGRNLNLLIRFLLLLVSLSYVLFLVNLLFTGTQALWENVGSGMLMLWQATILFFVSIVYRSSGAASLPLSRWLHWVISGSVALLPVASLITAWGLYLRIEQYGWTVSRCWAVLVWVLLALLSFSYLFAIIRWRDGWDDALGRLKIGWGLLVMVLMVAVNSPVLDFRSISAASQIQRLADEAGLLNDTNFYRHMRYSLARPGWLRMQQLQEQIAADDPERAARIERRYLSHSSIREEQEQVQAVPDSPWVEYWEVMQPGVLFLPSDIEVSIEEDTSLREALQTWLIDYYGIGSLPLNPNNHRLALIALDSFPSPVEDSSPGSAGDGVEYLLMVHDVSETSNGEPYRLQLIRRSGGEWQETLEFRGTLDEALFESLVAGDVELSPLAAPWFQQIRTGDELLLPCVRDPVTDTCMPLRLPAPD